MKTTLVYKTGEKIGYTKDAFKVPRGRSPLGYKVYGDDGFYIGFVAYALLKSGQTEFQFPIVWDDPKHGTQRGTYCFEVVFEKGTLKD